MTQAGNNLTLPGEFVTPDYAGGTIANIPATVAALLQVPFDGLPPLRRSAWQALQDTVERVVVILIDAFGWNLLEAERPFLQPFLQQAAVVEQITSIFPSTTVAALSSLWTGTAPAQHGLVGLRLFFPEYAVLGQLLSFSPTFGRYPDSLVEAGLDPKSFLHTPGFGEQLTRAGVESHAFKGHEIVDSVLSQMHDRGVTEDHGVISVADMLVQMCQLLESKKGQPLFISAYWPSVDMLSHIYGWDSEAVRAELRAIIMQIQTEFLERLSPAARRKTVVVLAADHGQVRTPLEQHVYLEDHPELEKMLFMRAAGEPRVPYLYARQGCVADMVAYINSELGHAMVAWPAEAALGNGLLGPQPFAPQTVNRVGDVVVALRHGHVLLDSRARQKGKKPMLGRHGGMTQAEMQVPFIGLRLDG